MNFLSSSELPHTLRSNPLPHGRSYPAVGFGNTDALSSSSTSSAKGTSAVSSLMGPLGTMNRLQEALIYAAQLHQTQLRKGTSTPYLSHLMAVSSIVMEYGGNEDEAIAGLLHDAVEDQGGLPVLAEIRRRFGDAVADIVYGCTDAEVIPKPPWKERKVAYIQHLETATPSILLVSASDKLHNVRNILSDYRKKGEQTWSLFKGGKEGTLWYYRSLLTVFERKAQSQQVSPDLIQELGRCVETLEKLSKTTP